MTRLIDADSLEPYYRLMQDNATGVKMMALPDGIVDQQPTVDAVPVRHGRWVDHEEMHPEWNNTEIWHRCSECGYETAHSKTPYCPNCGARMDEE